MESKIRAVLYRVTVVEQNSVFRQIRNLGSYISINWVEVDPKQKLSAGGRAIVGLVKSRCVQKFTFPLNRARVNFTYQISENLRPRVHRRSPWRSQGPTDKPTALSTAPPGPNWRFVLGGWPTHEAVNFISAPVRLPAGLRRQPAENLTYISQRGVNTWLLLLLLLTKA